jgi:acyl-CoA oxidase
MSAKKRQEFLLKEHVGNFHTINEVPGILIFLPMLYIAWSDGNLSPTEILAIRQNINEQKWLNYAEKEVLSRWLNPDAPPTTHELKSWLKIIREEARGIPQSSRNSLASLGLEVARLGSKNKFERCATPEACGALDEIEEAFGVIGFEAAQDLLSKEREIDSDKIRISEKPTFDIKEMQRILDGKHVDIREQLKALLVLPSFKYRIGLDKDEYRELILSWCLELAHQDIGALSYPEKYGGKNSFSGFLAAFETLAFHDLSLLVKFGVQFGLFGRTLLNLGSEIHHQKYLRDAATLDLPGCFAMTELGHGSNVRDIETNAKFDRTSGGFIIHTPSESARKEYIGNAAKHGRVAIVFAQLEIEGEQHGIHAFLVPIRSEDGEILPGVSIEDNGEKMGLNGVDNGRIWFDQVPIPLENLLNRFAEVSPLGEYNSSISSDSKRFFTMLATLVGGRLSIAAAAVSAAKSALTIAVRYANRRRQFGATGEEETFLIDYPSHQKRLMPLLANVYALDFGIKYLIRRFENRTEEDSQEVEVLAAGLKAFSTWNTTDTIQECRESCGGQGYLAENRFSALKADTEIFTTFEGDNTVLMQLVAKGCLTDFRHQFNEMKFFGIVKHLTKRAAAVISELNPVITRITDESHLNDSDFQLKAFSYREEHLLITVAKRIKKRIDDGKTSYEAFLECQGHLSKMAQAYVERVILEQFIEGSETVKNPQVKTILIQLKNIFALSKLDKDKGWFLESGYIEGVKAKAIRKQLDKLCLVLSPQAAHLVDAFEIPDALLGAPIALE